MAVQTATGAITVDGFEAFIAQPEHRDRLFELIDGEIVEKMLTEEQGMIAAQFSYAFITHLKASGTAGNVAVEARYRPAGSRMNDRLPDVSVVLGDRPVTRQGAAEYMPNICVEIQSPDDTPKQRRAKAEFYLPNGAKMVILVFPRPRVVEVLTADGGLILGERDTLDGGDVLPGFSLLIADLFAWLD